jgi:hypothetical protein
MYAERIHIYSLYQLDFHRNYEFNLSYLYKNMEDYAFSAAPRASAYSTWISSEPTFQEEARKSTPRRLRANTLSVPVGSQRSRSSTVTNSSIFSSPTVYAYRLQLRLCKLDRALTNDDKPTRLGWFYSFEDANEAALDLAKRCRCDGEVVILVRQKELAKGPPQVFLNEEYLIGEWIPKNNQELRVDSWYLMHEPQGYMTRDPEDSRGFLKVSGQVEVVKERPPQDVS